MHLYGRRLLGRAIETAPESVINVGVRRGDHSKVFLDAGCTVAGVSLLPPEIEHPDYTHYWDRFEVADLEPADLLWSSMTIEHMPNVGIFLTKCRLLTKKWFCVVAPADKTDIVVDGHLNFWTPAHLIYNMVIAGWDCSEAKWYTEGRDIGLMVERKDRPEIELAYDTGDYELLKPYFPVEIKPRNTDPWLPDNFS